MVKYRIYRRYDNFPWRYITKKIDDTGGVFYVHYSFTMLGARFWIWRDRRINRPRKLIKEYEYKDGN